MKYLLLMLGVLYQTLAIGQHEIITVTQQSGQLNPKNNLLSKTANKVIIPIGIPDNNIAFCYAFTTYLNLSDIEPISLARQAIYAGCKAKGLSILNNELTKPGNALLNVLLFDDRREAYRWLNGKYASYEGKGSVFEAKNKTVKLSVKHRWESSYILG